MMDLCPNPSQFCLDGFEFVDRVGFNRGGDAVFAPYVLGDLPSPPSIPNGGGGVEGRREALSRRPSRPCGACRRELEQRRWRADKLDFGPPTYGVLGNW